MSYLISYLLRLIFAMLPREHCICPLPFDPRGGTAGPTVKNSMQSAKSIWLLTEAAWKSLLHITGEQIASSPPVSRSFCFGVFVFLAQWALLAISSGRPLVSHERFLISRGLKHVCHGVQPWYFPAAMHVLSVQCQVCVVALRCLVKKLKWGTMCSAG